MYKYEELLKRYTLAKANKQLWNEHIKECYRFALPEREIIDDYSPGAKKMDYVFDFTAIDSVEDFATRLESQITPPTLNWIKLEAGSDVPKDQVDEVNTLLDEMTKTIFENIRSSNFSSAAHEAYLDLAISTGALIVEPGDGIQSHLNFRAVSLSQLYLERSSKGMAETVFRDIKVEARDIKTVWPQAKLSKELKNMVKDKPETEVTIIEGVVEDLGTYTSILLCEATNDILNQTKEDSSPWVVFRETTIPGEVYGRGRVMRCLPAIKTLNKMTEDHLKAAAFTANPMYTATDDGVINPYNVNLTPGSVMPVGSNDSANPTLRPLPIAGDYNILQYDIGMLQDQIRRTLMSRPFGNIEETPVRSATEMSIRKADQAETTAGASGRIQVELLERVIARCVHILKKAGKVAPVKVDGKEVKIKFTSPAAKQQDEQTLATIGRFIEFMAMFPPETVMEQIKVEDFPGEVADILGVPSNLKRTEQEKKQRAQQAQQAQAQQANNAVAMEKEMANAQQGQ